MNLSYKYIKKWFIFYFILLFPFDGVDRLSLCKHVFFFIDRLLLIQLCKHQLILWECYLEKISKSKYYCKNRENLLQLIT